MSDNVHYIAVRQAATGGFSPGRAAGWLGLVGMSVFLLIGGFVTWQWVDHHILSLGIEDAGSTTVNQAELLDRVRTFELVTTKDTYDTNSNTDFHKRLNLGVTKIGLPGFVAGQELDVDAKVTVSAGVDMARITPDDIEVIQQGTGAVVVIRIPEAYITSTEIDPESFDISTSKGILTRFRTSIGFGEKDVRDGAVAAVTTLAREEAVRGGLLEEARLEAKNRLQGFLTALPQPAPGTVIYLVEFQAGPPH